MSIRATIPEDRSHSALWVTAKFGLCAFPRFDASSVQDWLVTLVV